jgi:hypothetical protein
MLENLNENCGDRGGFQKVGEVVEVIDEGDMIEVVDIEIYAKEKKKPLGKAYRIRVDKVYYVVPKRHITGAEILALAGKLPDKWRLHQKLHGGVMEEIKPDQVVDLAACGIERFVTMETCQTDGEQAVALLEKSTVVAELPPPRRQFRLPADDEDYLDGVCDHWETLVDGGGRWLLLHFQQMRSGFSHDLVTIAFRIEGGYPPAKLDMVYVYPPLARADGRAIPTVSTQSIDGKEFQRWSRHYEWREGVDSVATHHIRMERCIADELKR